MHEIERIAQDLADDLGATAELRFLVQRRQVAEDALHFAEFNLECALDFGWGTVEYWAGEVEQARQRVAALRDGLA